MSAGRVCTHCGCSEIDIDQARGDAVCTGCGSVLEDQIIVSEVQFQESGGGSSSVIGQFVSSEGIKSHTLGSSFQQGFNRESRAITLQKAKKKIQYVGAQLHLNQHCIDTAFNFFKMAVNKRLTRGRKTMHVVAACVYLVCRTEGTPHMLLDLSDILQVNVYSLGKTYLQLSRELCINVPAIDPCLYIPRFAHKLEFDEKSHEVSMTAMRLVQRMKRDWIHTGRRPSGLCGAALLVAARIHDFGRTLKDIIKVVRVCETTIRKRLNEFSNTASSQLTIDEFQRIDLEEEADPPAFTASKMKAKLAQMEENNQLKDLTSEVSCLQEEIEKTLEKTQRKPRGPWAAYANAASESPSSDVIANTPPFSQENRVPEVLSETRTLTDNSVSPNMDMLTPPSSQATSAVASRSDTPNDERDPEVSKLEERELTEVTSAIPVEVINPGPTAASIGIKDVIADCMKEDEIQETSQGDGELDLTGIDDAELDRWILGEEEVKVKTELWMIANADYLREQKEKEEREAKEKEENANKPEKKTKRKAKKRQPIQANTAKEAIEQMLQQKRISAKINYDVLKDLNKSGTASPNAVNIPESPLPQRSRKPPVNTLNVDTSVMFSTLSRFRRSSINRDAPSEIPEEPVVKKVRLDDEPTEVVEESGPVQYGDQAEEEEEEDYEGEEDYELVSAAELLGHTGYTDEPEYYDTYDID